MSRAPGPVDKLAVVLFKQEADTVRYTDVVASRDGGLILLTGDALHTPNRGSSERCFLKRR